MHGAVGCITTASAQTYPGTTQATAGRSEMSWPAGVGLPRVTLLQEEGWECIWVGASAAGICLAAYTDCYHHAALGNTGVAI